MGSRATASRTACSEGQFALKASRLPSATAITAMRPCGWIAPGTRIGSEAHCASYFHGWGEATARMWQEFRGLLEAELAAPACMAAACEAACQTFDALSASLHTALHERVATA